jgi:thiol:disulfide interchange protein
MSNNQHHRTQQSQRSKKMWMQRWPQLAILSGVVLLVAAVLILKDRTADPPVAAESKLQATATLPEASIQATATLPEAAGQAQAATELEQVSSQAAATALPDELPETRLEHLVAAGQPTLAFFHSNNCVQCIKMMEVVEQVYPEFDDSVVLVDVNVYDQRNASLLQRARIRAIPTQIFFDRTGQGLVVMGAMTPGQFREQMRTLAEGQ